MRRGREIPERYARAFFLRKKRKPVQADQIAGLLCNLHNPGDLFLCRMERCENLARSELATAFLP